MTWNMEWRKVIWSDEKKFNLDGPDGFAYYWHDLRKEPLIFSTRQQGGGGVMIWGSFGWDFKSELSFPEGRMNSLTYQGMLTDHLDQISDHFGQREWIFQQDNASIHSSKSTMAWLKRKKVNVMKWPALSPDLNPMENLWGILVRKVYVNGKQFYTINDLKTAIINAWNSIQQKELKTLVESMPNRIYNVILVGGAKTKY